MVEYILQCCYAENNCSLSPAPQPECRCLHCVDMPTKAHSTHESGGGHVASNRYSPTCGVNEVYMLVVPFLWVPSEVVVHMGLDVQALVN